MSKLNIIGTAERNIPCDAVHIYLAFMAGGASVSETSKKAMQNCDSFLSLLQENQIAVSEIRLEDFRTEKSYSKKEEYYSVRKIRLDFPFDMALLNQFDFWIQKSAFNIIMTTEFYISNLPEVRKALLKEAVEDSRQKAEMLAEAMHQKIIGLEEVIMDRNFRNQNDEFAVPACACSDQLRGKSASDSLKAPEQKESERIEVVWNIE
ncbi:MAG: SIMPL domain-containing protein [Ruminococcus sp.]|nr:SIMPL domain-containing protein [Ruminococcus sp.]